MTRRARGSACRSWSRIGWRGYFGFCQTPRVLTQLEAWIRRRLRSYLWRAVAERTQPLQRTAPSRRTQVQCSGRRRFADRCLAHVRTSGGPTGPAQPLLRLTRSSPTPCLCSSLTQSNRRGTRPVRPVVWEGWRREVSPYPDQSSGNPEESASKAAAHLWNEKVSLCSCVACGGKGGSPGMKHCLGRGPGGTQLSTARAADRWIPAFRQESGLMRRFSLFLPARTKRHVMPCGPAVARRPDP
jgi:Group II intron, maturase-specific domain